MAGSLNMNNNRIYNLKDTDQNTAENSVVTKKYVDSKITPKEDKTHFLYYNGNSYLLTKTPPHKETSYFIFRQNRTYVHTNTHGVSVFEYFTDSQLIFRDSPNLLWDIFIYVHIKTNKDSFVLCETWKKDDDGVKFVQVHNIPIPIKNSNGISRLFSYKFSVTINTDEILEIYIKDGDGRFIGDDMVFIQANSEISTFKKIYVEESAEIKDLKVEKADIKDLKVEKAEIKDLKLINDIVLPNRIPRLNVTDLTVSNDMLYTNGSTYNKSLNQVVNMQYLFNQIKPVEYISFRRGAKNAVTINITRMHPIIQLFNQKTFVYTNPNQRLRQIYLINHNFTLFEVSLYHRLYNRNLYPDAAGPKFNEKANIKMLAHFSTAQVSTILNESVLYDDTLSTFDNNSFVNFISNIRLNERIRILHNIKSEISTEILMKVIAIS